ncbi:MAG: hypothetical protein ACYC35_04485 [Pirellulales bacterium]
MSTGETRSRNLFETLRPGDVVEVVQTVKVGMKVWTTAATGAVVRIERRRHGLHHRRAADDKVFSDLIVLRRGDGELTTVSMDENTKLERVGSQA